MVNFFTYIKESVSYNSVYLFWHALRILFSNEIETDAVIINFIP